MTSPVCVCKKPMLVSECPCCLNDTGWFCHRCGLTLPEKKEERAFIKVDPQEFKDAKFDVKVDVERACCKTCSDVIQEGDYAGEPMCNHISCPCHTLASSEEIKANKDAIKTLQNGMDTPYTSKEPRVEEWEEIRKLVKRYLGSDEAQNVRSAMENEIRSLLLSERPQTIGEENDKNRLWFDRGMVQERSRLKGVVAGMRKTPANEPRESVADIHNAALDDIIKAI